MSACAFFDVDHTLINGSTGTELAKEGIKRGIIPLGLFFRIPLLYAQYRLGGFNPKDLESILYHIEGVETREMREMGRNVFEKVLVKRLFRDAVDALEYERSRGRTPVLATSSLEYVVEPIAEFLEVETIISTEVETDNGVITGKFKDDPAFGKGKHRKVFRYLEENNFRPEECSFYSDSYYDLPLLERVGEPVVVNPDRRLRRTARDRKWRITRFSRTLAEEHSLET